MLIYLKNIIPILLSVDLTLAQRFLDEINHIQTHLIVTEETIAQYERYLMSMFKKSMNTIFKLDFIMDDFDVKYTNLMSLIIDIQRKVLKPLLDDNDSNDDDLNDYFRPLSEYHSNPYHPNGHLNQLLWLLRRIDLEGKQTIEKLFDSNHSTNAQILKIVEFIKKSHDPKSNFVSLSQAEQKDLIDLITNQQNVYSKYALSLLITFLLRCDETAKRRIGLELIQTGVYTGDIGGTTFKNVNLILYDSSAENLILNKIFINLTHIKLSDLAILRPLDLSGHDLTGLLAEKTHFENLKLRFCSLLDASFKESTLKNCYFNNSNLFGSNFANVITVERCHFDFCHLEK